MHFAWSNLLQIFRLTLNDKIRCNFFLLALNSKMNCKQGSNWGGVRGDGIPLVENNDKKHPLCKTTVFPYHPLWIIHFVYYVKLIMHMKC